MSTELVKEEQVLALLKEAEEKADKAAIKAKSASNAAFKALMTCRDRVRQQEQVVAFREGYEKGQKRNRSPSADDKCDDVPDNRFDDAWSKSAFKFVF